MIRLESDKRRSEEEERRPAAISSLFTTGYATEREYKSIVLIVHLFFLLFLFVFTFRVHISH
jgi:hypothetical protein